MLRLLRCCDSLRVRRHSQLEYRLFKIFDPLLQVNVGGSMCPRLTSTETARRPHLVWLLDINVRGTKSAGARQNRRITVEREHNRYQVRQYKNRML
jgi:hypothetical protein